MSNTVDKAVNIENVEYIVFDFDGTLANSFDAIKEIAVEEVGEISEEDFELMRREGVKGVIKRYNIKPWELPRIIARFISRLKNNHKVPLYPEIKELIETLSKSYRLGILSSNSENIIRLALDRYEIADMFQFIYSQSSLFGKDKVMKKICKIHKIHPDHILYVGDEDRDIIACNKVGIASVAVTYGFNTEERLAKNNPDFIIHSPLELISNVLLRLRKIHTSLSS